MNPVSLSVPGLASPWAARFAIVLVYMVFGALLNSVGSVNLLAVQTLGISAADAALFDAFKDLPIALTSLLLAARLPSLGLRRAMLLGLALVTLACLLVWQAPGLLTLRLLFIAVGAAFAVVKVGSYALIGVLSATQQEHKRLMTLVEGLFMVGVLSGYALFGAMVDDSGARPLAWLRVYAWMAGAAAVAALVLARCRIDESEARSAASDGRPSLRRDLAGMWGLLNGLVLVFVSSAFLYVLIEQGLGTWLPTFNSSQLKLPASMSVWFAVLMPASTALGRLLSSVWLARRGWYGLLNFCLAAIAGLMIYTLLAPAPSQAVSDWRDAPLLAFALPAMGLFLSPIYPVINSAMLSVLPRHQHSAMTGLIVLLSALGGTTGSFVTGRLFMAFDARTAFGLMLLPLGLLALTLWRFHLGVQARAASSELTLA